MNKQQIIRAMKSYVGGKCLINKSEIGRCFGKGEKKVNEWTRDLQFLDHKKSKEFLIDDVAEKILEEATMY